MNLTLHVWRQKSPSDAGRMVEYALPGISPDMSFLEMLDTLNETLMRRGEEPVAFDHDCREGICGSCDLMIDGLAHGPERATTSLPAAHAELRRRRRTSTWSRGGPRRSPCSRTCAWTGRRWTASSRRAGSWA